ncbi:hypothetical protein IW262DRAFT_1515273 [Armillaria fumosa]|nr:hypothetical protein IW262DRAFT_1515273 [Armillaria fumosa]
MSPKEHSSYLTSETSTLKSRTTLPLYIFTTQTKTYPRSLGVQKHRARSIHGKAYVVCLQRPVALGYAVQDASHITALLISQIPHHKSPLLVYTSFSRPLRNALLEEGTALETLRMDSEDLWCPVLDGSFGSVDQLRNVAIMDEGNLNKFDIRHKHNFDVRDRTKGNSSWKRNPPPLDISHLKSLGIDIHGRYKLGIKQPVVILKWWTDMLKDLAEKGQVSNLEDLLLVVGICRREPYILEDLEGTWQLLDSLLTQNFPAFKSLRVAIKVFQLPAYDRGDRSKPQEGDRRKLSSFVGKEDAQGRVWKRADK